MQMVSTFRIREPIDFNYSSKEASGAGDAVSVSVGSTELSPEIVEKISRLEAENQHMKERVTCMRLYA